MDTEQTLSTRELAGASADEEFDRGGDRASASSEAAVDDRRDTSEEREGATAGSEAQDEPRTQRPSATTDVADDSPALLPRDENAEFQQRWESIQTGFVDEPRQTVEQADELVAHVMKRLAEGFAAERERLEGQWGRGEDVSTEDLRIALQRYRGFFQRLLSA
jgi:hypothetical protein